MTAERKKKFEALMHELQMYGFVLDEARLFLDTHPENGDALAYYKKYSALYEETKREYPHTDDWFYLS